MMDDSLVSLVLVFLTFALALNLLMTLRLAAIVQGTPELSETPFTLPAGEDLPDFEGRGLLDGRRISSEDLRGQASVLIFLSASCDDCRKKLPEITHMRPSMRDAGVRMWIMGMESEKRVRTFFKATALAEHVVLVDRKARRKLNPRSAAPFYVFVDHERIVQASNFIGDENWLSFVQQLQDIGREVEARA